MADPVEVHRKEVAQRIQIASSQGGWEGTHTDFKRELGSKPRDLAKLLKHILAFANTPRRTDAYIIFGVNENRDQEVFEHIGIPEGGFPTSEKIDELIRQYTTLREVFVDSHFTLADKRTPYIAIPLQYDGPHTMSRALYGGPGALSANEIFCRYGSSSVRANDRDALRMRSSWDTWFLDCRYEKNATSLVSSLAKRFPNHTVLTDMGTYVRLVYDSAISDEFGSHHAPVLVHAYSGFDPVEPEAVEQIIQDNAHAFRKTIVGPRFTSATREAAAKATVRCVPLEEIYFVNDPYATLCREFLRQWDNDRSTRHLSFVVDLDFRPSGLGISSELRKSVLTFLEEQLNVSGRFAVLVHGDFGCGKTTTAKQLVADLSNEYLRGDSNVPKVMYVDVNNIDIRSRRDECIENQLSRFRLPRECIDGLVAQVRDDMIHLIFDGVDEMARPYTEAGRHSGIELLRDVANRRAAVYFVRSSYYPQMGDMIAEFDLLSDHDFSKKQKGTIVAEILGLRQEQVTSYLESRLGAEEARLVRSGLHKMMFPN
jgi:NACHT domain/Putative DNA-binding domain